MAALDGWQRLESPLDMILDSRKAAILAEGAHQASIAESICHHARAADDAPHEASIVGRRRIWQVDASMHCSILGTCLTMNDLYALARRARCRLDPGLSAYQVHSWFVDYMTTQNELSKLADKALEKRHGSVASKVRRARTEEELEANWKESAAQGHIAAAYWGAMSHPLCSKNLHWKLFGEIHMLSHLVGASRRSDLSRLQELEVTFSELETELAELKHDHRAALADKRKLEDEFESLRRELNLSQRRLRSAQDRIVVLDSRTLASELEARIEDLERRLEQAEGQASTARLALADCTKRLEEATGAAELAGAQARELGEENAALEAELATSMTCSGGAEDARSEKEEAGLDGKRILCVGGVRSLVHFYRELVERHGGEFLHHDGGLEDSLDAVTRAMATVDVVLCPVDCVSHGACLRVKKACKHLGKPFVPLRSSGLSSFARSIRAISVRPSSERMGATK